MLRTFLLLLFFICAGTWLMAQSTFSEVSISSGINHLYLSQMKMGGGAAFLDYDKDGDEDLVVTGGLGHNKLYRNEGNGQFADVTAAAGISSADSVQTMGVTTGDIDNDGYREIFFTSMNQEPSVLLYNNGDGTFSDITFSSGIGTDSLWGTSATFGDFDNDGLLDLFVANYLEDMTILYDTAGDPVGFDPLCQPDYLYHNNGDLTFTQIAVAAGVADSGCGLAATFTDYNLDHRPDIFIANDHGMWNIPNQIYQNAGNNTFSNVSVQTQLNAQMYGMGIASGDFDHDEDLDYYITNIGAQALFCNNGNGTWTDTARALGVVNDTVNGLRTTGWGTAFLDYDNDTWADLFVCHGHITVAPFIANLPNDPDKLFRNNGGTGFTDVTTASAVGDTGMGRGMIYGDYDQDGDQDIVTVVIHYDSLSGEHTKLWQNNYSGNRHWLEVSLEGTLSNHDAYGAIIRLATNTDSWVQEISGGNSHMSQNSSIAHFGLGNDASGVQLLVTWPSGGQQIYYVFPVDRKIHLVEDSTQFLMAQETQARFAFGISAVPNPFAETCHLIIQSELAGEGMLLVKDLAGKQISEQTKISFSAGQTPVSIQQAMFPASGVYCIELIAGTHQASTLVVRQ